MQRTYKRDFTHTFTLINDLLFPWLIVGGGSRNSTRSTLSTAINRSSHQRCSIKKVFLKISQNSQENTCARVSSCRPHARNFIKRETLAQVFSCEFCEIFKNTFFTEQLWTTASELNPKCFFFYFFLSGKLNRLVSFIIGNFAIHLKTFGQNCFS